MVPFPVKAAAPLHTTNLKLYLRQSNCNTKCTPCPCRKLLLFVRCVLPGGTVKAVSLSCAGTSTSARWNSCPIQWLMLSNQTAMAANTRI